MNWPLILEFTKALAGPVAAVIAALFAVRAFRYQKLLERRLEWYAQAARALLGFQMAISKFPLEENKDAAREALDVQVQELLHLFMGAAMYADRKGYWAYSRFLTYLPSLPTRFTPEDSKAVIEPVSAALTALVNEIRKDLRIGRLQDLPDPPPLSTTTPASERGGQ